MWPLCSPLRQSLPRVRLKNVTAPDERVSRIRLFVHEAQHQHLAGRARPARSAGISPSSFAKSSSIGCSSECLRYEPTKNPLAFAAPAGE